MHPYINTALKAARNAGEIIMRAYDRLDLVKAHKKGLRDFVTNIDKASEEEIIHVLQTAYPSHSFLTEELGKIKGREEHFQWIIDPLDGTNNFVHGYPHFCISIALKIRNRIEHGLIYDPLRQDLFTASRGEGAQRNNHRIRVSGRYRLIDCLIGTGFSNIPDNYREAYHESLNHIAKQCLAVRTSGAAALDLAYVASGQLDGYWNLGLSTWDIAASSLLIREAGGLISDICDGGDPFKTGNIIASNSKIFKELSKYTHSLCKIKSMDTHQKGRETNEHTGTS